MLNIRPATKADAAAIAGLSGQLGYPAEERTISDRFAAIAADTRHAVLVAVEDGGALVGWIHIMPKTMMLESDGCEIGGLVVDEHHRGAGVGRALLAEAETWARACGYRELTVRSDTRRSGAHAFYPAQGFTRTKEQSVYKKPLV